MIKHLYYFKMTKEMNVSCDFVKHQLNCVLPANTMDVLLKVRMKSGEHTFREDVYTRTLKYRRWNNELRPFHSLKRRVADIFRKRNSFSDSSRSTSMQTIVNNFLEQCAAEIKDKDGKVDNDRESVNSDWSNLIPIKANNPTEIIMNDNIQKKRTVRNIVLVPYKPKPSNWGGWRLKSPYATSTVASPILDDNNQIQALDQENNQGDQLSYVPHSPYYELVHSPQFYENE